MTIRRPRWCKPDIFVGQIIYRFSRRTSEIARTCLNGKKMTNHGRDFDILWENALALTVGNRPRVPKTTSCNCLVNFRFRYLSITTDSRDVYEHKKKILLNGCHSLMVVYWKANITGFRE